MINILNEFRLRSRESALYLSVFGDPLTGVAWKKKFVQIFFHEQHLPIAKGWRKPTTLSTTATLTPLESGVVKPSTIGEGLVGHLGIER